MQKQVVNPWYQTLQGQQFVKHGTNHDNYPPCKLSSVIQRKFVVTVVFLSSIPKACMVCVILIIRCEYLEQNEDYLRHTSNFAPPGFSVHSSTCFQ